MRFGIASSLWLAALLALSAGCESPSRIPEPTPKPGCPVTTEKELEAIPKPDICGVGTMLHADIHG